MKTTLKAIILSALSVFTATSQDKKATAHFYDFSADALKGKSISMKSYEGKVVLVVNVASKCGFTPQYKGLEELYKKYESKGFVVLGFPCNQFGSQEPGSAEEISSFCSLNYGVTFPMFAKIDVNGDNTHPLYAYLKEALPGTLGNGIKWNFTKFLLDKKGNPVKRYGSITKPEEIAEDIEKLLK
ncbi:MAG: glutathione peroxidase [Bacteroidales bacterium]|nr:glutathione peroxidase [Bacteroidales bacterium]